MMRSLNLIGSSFRLTFQELSTNKTRTILSLTGVAFGIFCIILVLTIVNSFEKNIQDEVKSLGTNTIYIDKWDYSGGPDQPIWKYRARPVAKYEEVALIKQRSQLLDDIAFLVQIIGSISHRDDVIDNVSLYGITPAQMVIQPMSFYAGRFFSTSEFNSGSPVCVIGYTNAEELFGEPARAVGKQIDIKGRKFTVVGVIAKEGKSFIGWNYDNCVMLTYLQIKTLYDINTQNPILIAKGKEGVSTDALMDELEGIMRQVRKLSPRQEDNFSLNSVEGFSKALASFFVTLNIVGSIVGGISLIVGMFSIANIMFVTVKERTSIIGLKKAIGARKSSILFEFLTEATILCLLGGALGLFFVWIGTLIISAAADFPVFISLSMLFLTIVICIVVGILAGIIPASRAANMDPVVAIRS